MVEVLENIFIGDKIDAFREDTLANRNIKYIVNCANEIDNRFEQNPEIKYLHIKAVEDRPFDMQSYFRETFLFIEQARQQNIGVLVHCAYGKNRSATIMIAYLMKAKDLSFQKAFDFLAEVRPEICIQNQNKKFLVQYEKQLSKKMQSCCSQF